MTVATHTHTSATGQFRHLRGVPTDARIVPTRELIGVQNKVFDAVEHQLIIMASGPNGSGKTSSVSYALDAATEETGVPWIELRMTYNSNPKDMLTNLCDGLQVPLPSRDRERTQPLMLRRLLSRLSETPWAVWLDECEYASVPALRLVRHIFDDPSTRGALVLSGDERMMRTLQRKERALLSRVGRSQRFSLIRDQDVVEVMSAYHDIYAHTDEALLIYLNRLARGQFRLWARVIEVLAQSQEVFGGMPTHIDDEALRYVKGEVEWMS